MPICFKALSLSNVNLELLFDSEKKEEIINLLGDLKSTDSFGENLYTLLKGGVEEEFDKEDFLVFSKKHKIKNNKDDQRGEFVVIVGK